MSNLTRYATTGARILLGLAFVVFGANFFLHFIPQPPPEEPAATFIGALYAGQVLTVVKSIEIVSGVLLLSNRFVPLALALLAPILVAIVLFHAVFAPAGLAMGVILIGLEIGLAIAYRDAFAPMLRAKVDPVRASVAPEPAAAPAAA